jgi:DNA ligase-1
MTEHVMLAETYDPDTDSKKVIGWWYSEKYDGVRGLWKADEKKMYSRAGLEYSLPDFFREQLESISIDLDGEIWFGNDTFDLASGQARKGHMDEEKWKKNMIYKVFDTPNTELDFEDRIRFLQPHIKGYSHIKGVKFYKVKTTTNLEEELRLIECEKGEGIVFRKPKSKYVFKRSKDMLKYKSWSFDEATVIGYLPGNGRLDDMVGALKIENEQFGKFKVGSGLNDKQRISMDNNIRIENKKKDSSIPVIGDVITFRYKEVTKSGNPKQPTFFCLRDYE